MLPLEDFVAAFHSSVRWPLGEPGAGRAPYHFLADTCSPEPAARSFILPLPAASRIRTLTCDNLGTREGIGPSHSLANIFIRETLHRFHHIRLQLSIVADANFAASR